MQPALTGEPALIQLKATFQRVGRIRAVGGGIDSEGSIMCACHCNHDHGGECGAVPIWIALLVMSVGAIVVLMA
jgi:hypothetical protein